MGADHNKAEEMVSTIISYKGGECYKAVTGKPNRKMPGLKGRADRVCCLPVEITSGMVGKIVLQFGVVEIKTQGYKKLTKEQLDYLHDIVKRGGFAVVATLEKDNSLKWENVKNEKT